ncbi:SWIM zinc finger protein [Xylaria flabelliformis]|nr:SWIM zinc finger protein [Xylaria flabelliformis]
MSPRALRKRKLPSTFNRYDESESESESEPESEPIQETKKPRTTSKNKKNEMDENDKKDKKADEEKRLRRFRAKAPASFEIIYERATEQRFYVLNRSRCGTAECPEEDIEITGSTGNIYNVQIAQVPSCDCPHALKGNQCKHIIFVMSRVLRARHNLVYQLALLSSELREIFENAPPINIEGEDNADTQDPNRKQVEGDCPICYTPFEGAEATVYCRATCGQNMHKACFQIWAETKRQSGRGTVTCPMCRSPWQEDEGDMVKKVTKTGFRNNDGYINVADQLGISSVRGMLTFVVAHVGFLMSLTYVE